MRDVDVPTLFVLCARAGIRVLRLILLLLLLLLLDCLTYLIILLRCFVRSDVRKENQKGSRKLNEQKVHETNEYETGKWFQRIHG